MQNGVQFLNDACLAIAETLENVVKTNAIKYVPYDIDCACLKSDYVKQADITREEWFSEIFNSYNGATVYAIEVLSGPGNQRIIELYKDYIKTPVQMRRGTSALKSTADPNTKYLYVGKVKAVFHGRVIHHLGFHSSGQTVGLQIFHWLKGEQLQLRIHTYQFPQNMENFLEVLEGQLAKQLKPLIGKHR